jgi:hypothetical protein
MIGLELSWERLKAMRRMVFGLGLTQVLVCTVGLAALFMLMGQTAGVVRRAGHGAGAVLDSRGHAGDGRARPFERRRGAPPSQSFWRRTWPWPRS